MDENQFELSIITHSAMDPSMRRIPRFEYDKYLAIRLGTPAVLPPIKMFTNGFKTAAVNRLKKQAAS